MKKHISEIKAQTANTEKDVCKIRDNVLEIVVPTMKNILSAEQESVGRIRKLIDELNFQKQVKNNISAVVEKYDHLGKSYNETYLRCLYTVNSLITQNRIYEVEKFLDKVSRDWKLLRNLTFCQMRYLWKKLFSAINRRETEMIYGRLFLWQIPLKIRTFSDYRTASRYVRQFQKIHAMLPQDKRLWNYNMNALNSVRPEIDKLTGKIIGKCFKQEWDELRSLLEKQSAAYTTAYGSNSQNHYLENKEKELYYRFGNAILKEMKRYDRSLQQQKAARGTRQGLPDRQRGSVKGIGPALSAIKRIQRFIKSDFEHRKNLREFEKLQQEME